MQPLPIKLLHPSPILLLSNHCTCDIQFMIEQTPASPSSASADIEVPNGLPFRHVGILANTNKDNAEHLANQIGNFLTARGVHRVWYGSAWHADEVMAHLPDLDLLITLGGDGTMLRAARMGAMYDVPMLGVKMGRLGFLAEIFPEDWRGPLEHILNGDYWIEERLMVRARVERAAHVGDRPTTVCEYDALNDVVLSRGGLARVVRVSVRLDGGYLTQYTCDGIIVSTATGSTGYALAVGGPILPPELRNILVIPIAPHLSMDRSVVLSEGSEVRIRVSSDHRAVLTVDGQVEVEVSEEDEIVIVGSGHLARFMRQRDRSYFYQTLMDKLSWAG